MPLPETITQIFKRKQKSYKMVLILSLIEEMRAANQERVSFDKVKDRFLKYFIDQQEKGNWVDKPSGRELWRNVPKSQLKDIINSPVNALSQDFIYLNSEENTIGFHGQIQKQLGDEELKELENLAYEELRLYNGAANDEEVDVLPQTVEPLKEKQVTGILHQIQAHIRRKGFFFPEHLIENFYLSLKAKPFVILAGISGTGKTRLVKLFAEALGATRDNGQFSLIPVRPDWSDPADLLGYKDLSGRFQPGPITKVLVDARQPENRHKPYFICLDEMNLARVEHYFSDMLSVLETQEWREGAIQTHDLISPTLLDTPEDQETYGGLGIPENVFLIGTVNMDETTHPFSKKVLDRANTLEFNYINLQQYPQENGQEAGDPAELTELNHLFVRSDYLQLVDAYEPHKELVVRTTERLVKINTLLEDIHAHVGFRVRDAICFYMIYNDRYGLMDEEEAFDWQLLQKILPRIQGSHSSVRRVLLNLMKVAMGSGAGIAVNVQDLTEDASPLYMRWAAGQNPPGVKHPQSARKLAYMLRRLEEDGFTSFWLS
ncbi:McrB family protein [Paenibacillus typhae]|uniref:McrB family protein n=1 Tax=Paenibacillus typhae TaxID=1174501 RepID=UPI001C8DBCAB|nr:AAA family ATPase [Paenibacillus typhae]MBY0011637.1 AAA family ATPase [Paenibacillus typhae]